MLGALGPLDWNAVGNSRQRAFALHLIDGSLEENANRASNTGVITYTVGQSRTTCQFQSVPLNLALLDLEGGRAARRWVEGGYRSIALAGV